MNGYGLHTGKPSRVSFVIEPGPVRIRAGGEEHAIRELGYSADGRATIAMAGRMTVRTVEHLFAALAARSIYGDLVIVLEGAEVPLLDGGAAAFFDALPQRTHAPLLSVARAGTITLDASEHVFTPSDARVVEARIQFADERIAPEARWEGDAADFRERIAPARTFAFEAELAGILERGLASHVTPESVVAITKERILSAGAPFTADEPARHKLLDLVGDLYAYGGPPTGHVRATRPGHRANHAAIQRALEEGILVTAL